MWSATLWLLVAALVSVADQQQPPAPQLDAHSWKLDCANIHMKDGMPLFFGGMTEVRVGIAARKTEFTVGEPVAVDLWIDNRTEEPVLSGGRCGSSVFHEDVFDSSGHRLIGIQERAKIEAEKKGQTTVEV